MTDNSLRAEIQALRSHLNDYKDANDMLELNVKSLENKISDERLEHSRLSSIIAEMKAEEVGYKTKIENLKDSLL